MRWGLWILLLGACTPIEEEDGILDLVREVQEPPDGGIQLATPPLEVAPFEEVFWCYYGTHTGENVGVDFVQPFVSPYNHHTFIQAAQEGDPADGELVDCSDYSGMEKTTPLFDISGNSLTADGNYLQLPEGVAISLKSGQRWLIEAHFVNPTAQTLSVNVVFNLGVVPEDEVETWAASYQFDLGPPEIAAGQDVTQSFDCAFPQDVSLITLMGHMHQYGQDMSIDRVDETGSERIYTVDHWEAEYRDYPPIQSYELGELMVGEEQVLHTSCHWFNTTEQDLGFPEEMCSAKGIAAPMQDPLFCVDGIEQ
jgi:hypothetical protein